MNKHVYLGLSILEVSKIVIFEFWYDYVKPTCNEKAKYVIQVLIVHCTCKIWRYLWRHCKRCWKKVWHFKLWVRNNASKRKKTKKSLV